MAYIIKCKAENKIIANIDNLFIEYEYRGKQRKYFPDFIVNNNEIVEVKGLGFLFEKKLLQIEAKKKALEEFCVKNPSFTSKFVTDKDIENRFKKKAKDIARKEETCRLKKQKK